MKLFSTLSALLPSLLLVLIPTSGVAGIDLEGSLGEAGGHTRYVAPISNPVLNETPFITTEARPMYMHQVIPSSFAGTEGGNIDMFAMQLRVAITDRLGFIASKDGYADIEFDEALSDEEGFANIAFGFKYAAYSDPASGTIITPGIRYEAPTGDLSVDGISLQGAGDGLLDIFVSGATTVAGKLGLQSSLGIDIAMDTDHDSTILHYSVHGDYEVLPWLFPVLELNGFSTVDDGDRTPLDVEGMDLVNFGSVDSGTVITFSPGIRFQLHENVDFGVAYEQSLTERKDIMNWRIITDLVLHL